jgi:hypothetical protein
MQIDVAQVKSDCFRSIFIHVMIIRIIMTCVKAINLPKPSKSLENRLSLLGPKAREFRSVQGPEMHFVHSCA